MFSNLAGTWNSYASQYARLLSRTTTQLGQALQAASSLPTDVNMVQRQRRSGWDEQHQIATQKVSRATSSIKKGTKANQAWKYPNNTVVRAPSIWLNGRLYTDPKADEKISRSDQTGAERDVGDKFTDNEELRRRKQESNFFITVNTNRVYRGAEKTAADNAFTQTLNDLSSNEAIGSYLKFGPCDPFYASDIAHDVLLPGIGFTATIEVGEIKHNTHAHIYMTIEHYSQVQIDGAIMGGLVTQLFNKHATMDSIKLRKKAYVMAKLLPQSDWGNIIKQYIRKGMDGGA